MKYIDISQTIYSGMKKYPSDPSVKISQFKSLKKGNSCNLSKLVLGSHSGTHIDSPRHIFNKGKSVDDIRIKDLILGVVVMNTEELSTRKRLAKKIKGVLIKSTKNKTGLSLREAKEIVSQKIKVVGIDQMSIEESRDKSHSVHRLLLGQGKIIIENLDLTEVKPGYYQLICLPLKIAKGDGAPARAILIYD